MNDVECLPYQVNQGLNIEPEKIMGDKTSKEDMKKAAKAFSRRGASKGGKARAEKLTADERKQIAIAAAEKRWGKSKKRN